MRDYEDVYRFWFEEHSGEDWFGGKPEFDQKLDAGFRETLQAVERGEAWKWRKTARGRLCEIMVLDQFSRQLYRGEAAAFANDRMALTLAQEMVAEGLDLQTNDDERMFVYLPYMHSESLIIHEESVRLHEVWGNEDALKYERLHYDLIARFGRYPKRNAALGRDTTPEEQAYIDGNREGFF